jgi:hypothetical protein
MNSTPNDMNEWADQSIRTRVGGSPPVESKRAETSSRLDRMIIFTFFRPDRRPQHKGEVGACPGEGAVDRVQLNGDHFRVESGEVKINQEANTQLINTGA